MGAHAIAEAIGCPSDKVAQLDEVLRHLSAAGVRSLTSQPPTLEELFLRHYAGATARSRS